MSFAYCAVALDYDGTLTSGGRPAAEVLAALERTRAAGRKRILVTGRIVAELLAEFPDAREHFDAIVAENGAVVLTPLGTRYLGPPIPGELEQELKRAGAKIRRGEVLLATRGEAAQSALEAIARLGLDCQLVRNRGELMVLPAGVTKGSGLREALGDLGVSQHSTVGVGDAENDHALLEACELGVAVANAVPPLQARADVVLSKPAGEGVVELLDGPLVRGEIAVRPRRWHIELGDALDGAPMRVPGSGVNVLITGASGSGKSFLAGLIAERLIELGYSLCVIDPEGDHTSLRHLRGALAVGTDRPLPAPEELTALIRHRFGSLVVDLSQLPPEARSGYAAETLRIMQRARERTGAPHWILLDEAHLPLARGAEGCGLFERMQKGLCLATYRPDLLCPEVRGALDVALFAVRDQQPPPACQLEMTRGVPLPDLARAPRRAAVLVDGGLPPVLFEPHERRAGHVRHWHKYVQSQLPEHLRFVFRTPDAMPLFEVANVAELHEGLLAAPAGSLEHHARHGDLSRWTREVLQDPVLADDFLAAERALAGAAEPLRHQWLQAIERRYLDESTREPRAIGRAS